MRAGYRRGQVRSAIWVRKCNAHARVSVSVSHNAQWRRGCGKCE